jgi:hypothetical protein
MMHWCVSDPLPCFARLSPCFRGRVAYSLGLTTLPLFQWRVSYSPPHRGGEPRREALAAGGRSHTIIHVWTA